MSTPEQPTVGYIIVGEAWYADAATRTIHGSTDIFTVGSYYPDGGCDWEFTIVEVDLGSHDTAMRVQVFDDAYAAFAEIPAFFEALATRSTHATGPLTQPDYLDLLQRLGYIDRTNRTNPYAEH